MDRRSIAGKNGPLKVSQPIAVRHIINLCILHMELLPNVLPINIQVIYEK
jgi:hypothetical protein